MSFHFVFISKQGKFTTLILTPGIIYYTPDIFSREYGQIKTEKQVSKKNASNRLETVYYTNLNIIFIHTAIIVLFAHSTVVSRPTYIYLYIYKPPIAACVDSTCCVRVFCLRCDGETHQGHDDMYFYYYYYLLRATYYILRRR